jgi:diguanylate cyclase (GGDEF)-like protein
MTAPSLKIAFISKEQPKVSPLKIRLESKGYQLVTLSKLSSVLGFIYSDPPDIIIADLTSADDTMQALLNDIEEDSYFSIIPIIGLVDESNEAFFDWDRFPLDDFVSYPINYNELFNRLQLAFKRIHRVFDNNPLTKLPGNTSIQQAIVRAIGKPMAVCYVDINDFKPYNDTYGFTRGDEILRMLARIIANVVKESGDGGFSGHIGGDDFVFVVPVNRAETVCKTIIDHFKVVISSLFGDKEKADGYYISRDRKGREQQVPLMGIAIAVVPTDSPGVQHAGKVAEIAAELKKQAKKSQESCYLMERRKGKGVKNDD